MRRFILIACLFLFSFLLFVPKASAQSTCYGTGEGPNWSDVEMSRCTGAGLTPPANTCNASGNWEFSYYVCQTRVDSSTGLCDFQTAPRNFTCSAADACEGGSGGGTGYSAAGHVVAGHCSPGSYVEGNPASACVSYGYYKQCCSSGGIYPATYCSNGLCPAGSITGPGNTSCGPANTPTPVTTSCPGDPGDGSQNSCMSGSSCPGGYSVYGNPLNNACGAGQVCCNRVATACPGFPGDGSQNFCRAGSCNAGETVYGSSSFNTCGAGQVCCNSNPSACPGSPGDGSVNACRSGSCNAGETVYGSSVLNACGAGQVCCNSIPSACPNNPPEGGTNACITGSSCPGGTSLYGSSTNNACGAGKVCCRTTSVTATPTTACRNVGQTCGGANGSCCGTVSCTGGICAGPTATATTAPAATPTSPPACGPCVFAGGAGAGASCTTNGQCCSGTCWGSPVFQCGALVCAPPDTPTPTPFCFNLGPATCGAGVSQCCSPNVCASNGTSCIPPPTIATTAILSVDGFTVDGAGNTTSTVPSAARYNVTGPTTLSNRTFQNSVNTTINPGTYTITATSVAGYTTQVGTYNGFGGYTWADGSIKGPIGISAGDTYSLAFRYVATPFTNTPSPTPPSLIGSIYVDTDKDGVKDVGESLFTNPVGIDVCYPQSQVAHTFIDTVNGLYAYPYNQFSSFPGGLTCIFAEEIPFYKYTTTNPYPQSYFAPHNPTDFGVFPAVSILGWLTGAAGTNLSQPPAGASVSVTGPSEGGSTVQTQSTRSFNFSPIYAGTYVVTAAPVTGYNIRYMCNGGNCGFTQGLDANLAPAGTWFSGNSFTKVLPDPGNWIDVYFSYTPAKTPPVPCNVAGAGDVNGDGYVTALDTTMVSQHIVGLITLTPAQFLRANVHPSAGVDIQDLVLIANYANGTSTTFPVCTTIPNTPTLTSPPVCPGVQAVSGVVLVDNGSNLCASGSTPYTTATTVQFNRSNGVLTTTTNGAGAYAFNDVSACTEATKTLTLQLAAPYTVSAVQMSTGGPWSPNPSYTSPTFNQTTPRVINWCVSNGGAWFQVNSGDVRYPRVSNPIPVDGYASTGNNTNAGLFYSSTYLPNYNGKTVSAPNWNVPQEYDYNADFKNGLGSMSYSFYMSQARTKNIPITSLNSSSEDFFSRPSGVYRRNGDLTLNIPAGAFAGGKHIVALVNGNVAINGPINVPTGTGALFIVAAKGDIVIGQTVGTATLSETPATATQLDGYYSAERNITILSTSGCNTSTPDRRLNVSGALIANSLHPFASDTTGGKINNTRSLCAAGNALYPTLSVYSRPEFLTQLTDFYKFTYKTFKEVAP